MIVYLIAAVGGAGLLLLALKAWSSVKAMPRPHANDGFTFRSSAGTIDRWVKGADDWMQHLRKMPLFYVGILGTCIMLGLSVHFGMVRGEQWGVLGIVIVASLFGLADLAIPFIALRDATDDGKFSRLGTTVLIVATFMSVLAAIGSTSEIATTTAARMDGGLINRQDTIKTLEAKQNERNAIKIDRGADALAGLAKVEEELQEREASKQRGGCGRRCDEHRKAAADLRAREADQRRKEQLTGEIAALKARLSGSGTHETRTDADAMATVISGMSGGLISRDGFRVYALPSFSVVLVVLLALLWYYVGGMLWDAIVWERQYRAEIADTQREALGLPPKYTTPQPATALLTGPSRIDAKSDPTVVINLSLEDMRRRFANDHDLLETDRLFDTLMFPAEGGSVPTAALYRAYKVATLTRDPRAFYMTQPTMAEKLRVIARHRADTVVTADGVIEGWVLKPPSERTLEAANVE